MSYKDNIYYKRNSFMFSKLIAVKDSFPAVYSGIIEFNNAYSDVKEYIELVFRRHAKYVKAYNMSFKDKIDLIAEGIELPKSKCNR